MQISLHANMDGSTCVLCRCWLSDVTYPSAGRQWSLHAAIGIVCSQYAIQATHAESEQNIWNLQARKQRQVTKVLK